MRNERVIAWDLLKLFAIFLVVWGHCMQHLLDVPIEQNPMFLWISSFHMPLFMAIAGLFAERSFSRPLKDYISKRGSQLLIPWLSWSVIVLVVCAILGLNVSARSIANVFVNSLWFLKSLFVCGILALIGFKHKRHIVLWIFLSFLLSQIFLIWNVFTMYPCFLFGIFCGRKIDWLTEKRLIIMVLSGIPFIILSIVAANSPDFWARNMGIRATLFSGEVSIYDNLFFLGTVIAKRYCQILLGCLGCTFFFSLFLTLFNNGGGILPIWPILDNLR